jgi:hypothetical protein
LEGVWPLTRFAAWSRRARDEASEYFIFVRRLDSDSDGCTEQTIEKTVKFYKQTEVAR